MTSRAEPARPAPSWLAPFLVVLAAVVPSFGTLTCPWIAEDSLLLAQAHGEGSWPDWTRSQGGLEVVRFWRPLVSATWDAQEAATGIDVLPLRVFNLALHALASVLALGTARRLGLPELAAFVVGAWVATFPEQGGTCTWLAGRTDLLCATFLLASGFAALGRRPFLAAPLVFLACASKEFGFLAPLWIAALLFARGEGGVVRRSAPAIAVAAGALLWRTLALGGVGGYAGSAPPLALGVPGAARAVSSAFGWSLGPLALLWLVSSLRRGAHLRLACVGFALGALALLPLYDLLAGGDLAPQNRRLLFVSECALALAAGAVVARNAWRPCVAVLGALLVARAVLARADTAEWARAGWAGEVAIQRARAAVEPAEPSRAPVWSAEFPSTLEGAYCLGFGVAARFVEPFPATPRPVWPWRLLFLGDPARERTALVSARADGTLWPLEDPATVAPLALEGIEGRAVALDESVLPGLEDRSPRWRLRGGPSGALLEAVIATDQGYEPFPLGRLDAEGAASGSLRELVGVGNRIATVGEFFVHVDDLGARRAYLQVRACGADGAALAASPWLELSWSPELAARR